MWKTEFRDPGVADPNLDYSMNEVQDSFLDLNTTDFETINVRLNIVTVIFLG